MEEAAEEMSKRLKYIDRKIAEKKNDAEKLYAKYQRNEETFTLSLNAA